jgi:hypothetical protein
VKVIRHDLRLDSSNIMEVIAPYDVILDGSDNFTTKYLINDAAVLANKPNLYGSIFRFDGQASTFVPRQGPCYRCLFPEPTPTELPPSCDEAGVLGVLPGMVGMVQATEAVKLILGKGRPSHRAPAHLRRAGDGVQRVQDPPRSQLRGLRRASDHPRSHRPRVVVPLRAAAPRRRGGFVSRLLTEVPVLESILDAIGNTPLLPPAPGRAARRATRSGQVRVVQPRAARSRTARRSRW